MTTLETTAHEGYRRLRPDGDGGAVVLGCDLVWVEGPEAESFLHGLLSNDVAGLEVGGSCEALLLDAKGHIHHGLHVHRGADAEFTLVTAHGRGETLVQDLERLHVSEDLEIFADEGELIATNAPGGTGVDLEIAIRPGLRGLVGDGSSILASLGVPRCPPESLAALRIAAGEPDPAAEGEGRLVQEAGLEAATISFTKGCYLGQETVARVAHRGKVNRGLVGLRLDAPAAPGAAVRLDEREVGSVTSSVLHPTLGPIALAIIRAGAGPNAQVEVDGSGAGRVASLPFDDPAADRR